ncbi:hypothetical protein ACFWOL_02200, partial [Streptomyces sp. NPDC058442]|uniref:hypothetical protein n=1 Tax=Streptomyces sp. NPDC058442 TaxID=3346503 RepID=UPI00366020B3
MRSARMLLATATATAALVVGAPAAFAAHMGDSDHDKSSYSKEHQEDSSHDEDDHEKKPYGGVHTGGGALTAVGEDDGEYKDEKDDGEYKGEEDEGDYKKGEEDEGDYKKGDKGDEYKNDKDDEYKK